jgi:hypothetical protein
MNAGDLPEESLPEGGFSKGLIGYLLRIFV